MSANIVFKTTILSEVTVTACDYVSGKTGLSKMKVKDAMNKGALWVRRKHGTMRRLRRATAPLASGDSIEFYYDEELLSLVPGEVTCISDQGRYSVWYKPAGLLSQGTKYCDHCSLTRQVEIFFGSSREIFPVHRLDREVSGLIVVAHTRDAAAKLSGLFRQNRIAKQYRAEVLGKFAREERKALIGLPLDGKPSVTRYEVCSYSSDAGTSLINVSIETGRLHQIRRHFEMIGHPVMGDPRYGKGNKNREGMKLSAISLRFVCPYMRKEIEFRLPEQNIFVK